MNENRLESLEKIDMDTFRKFRVSLNKLTELIDAAFLLRVSEGDYTLKEIEDVLESSLKNVKMAYDEFERVKKTSREDFINYYPSFLNIGKIIKDFEEAHKELCYFVATQKPWGQE